MYLDINPSTVIFAIINFCILVVGLKVFLYKPVCNMLDSRKEEVANNLKKNGGFVPGIRPGKPTVEYLTKILNHIIFIGACALIIIQLVPIIVNGCFGASVSFGGTSLIIIVSVILETLKQIESQMLVRNYKGFLNN